jgi:hypothetical protein
MTTKTNKTNKRNPEYSFRLFSNAAKGFILDDKAINLHRIRLGLALKDIVNLYKIGNLDDISLNKLDIKKDSINSLLSSLSSRIENLLVEYNEAIDTLDTQIELNKSLVTFKSIPIDDPIIYPVYSKIPLSKRLTRALQMLDQYMVRLHKLFETGCVSEIERARLRKDITKKYQKLLNDIHLESKPFVSLYLASNGK